MKKFLSVISFTILLFLPIKLICSEPNDFNNAVNNCEKTTSFRQKPYKKLIHQAEPGTPQQINPQQSQPSSIFSSPEAQFAAKFTATVVTTIAKGTYDVSTWAITQARNAYKESNQNSEKFEPCKSNNSDIEVNSDSSSDSDSDSGSEFCKIKTEKKAPKRKTFCKDQVELQDNLHNDPARAINSLTRVVKDYFEKQDTENLTTQKDMYHTFTLLDESAKNKIPLKLDAVIADKYNEAQIKLLDTQLKNHVNNIEPAFKMAYQAATKKAENSYTHEIAKAEKKRDLAIKKAEDSYYKSLNKSKKIIYTLAYNSAYLDKHARKQQFHPAHDLTNFKTDQSTYTIFTSPYENFIANTRKHQTETSIIEQKDLSLSDLTTSMSLDSNNANNNSNIAQHSQISGGKNKNKK